MYKSAKDKSLNDTVRLRILTNENMFVKGKNAKGFITNENVFVDEP
jgi:hypothetical protein